MIQSRGTLRSFLTSEPIVKLHQPHVSYMKRLKLTSFKWHSQDHQLFGDRTKSRLYISWLLVLCLFYSTAVGDSWSEMEGDESLTKMEQEHFVLPDSATPQSSATCSLMNWMKNNRGREKSGLEVSLWVAAIKNTHTHILFSFFIFVNPEYNKSEKGFLIVHLLNCFKF